MTTAANSTDTDALAAIVENATRPLAGMFERMHWAEDEITQAIRRHPAKADTLWHSFGLLTATNKLMATEFVYRSHCRELLERVAADEDTRPGTATEVCLVMHELSRTVPVKSSAAGLYFRMWAKAFPDQPNFAGDRLEHYEALNGSTIDDDEADMRRKLTVATRSLSDIECGGRHHGEIVHCIYATAADPE
jgi:hypothetical protein